ncbi:HNH endonuclease [Microbulbifer sp. A4B17]|uniref:HNH endonuclease signature motif containing protein n=1 Tax=Microbulbifer sp. A4B17 TaxID=359370 RepID=UPI000D52B7BF|nr:HNH endonuclease signature motif containing protein [Microbulbifer sp. A4B17]AWF80358.1 HNH endonuclease [Microbulbifer sp. A4B17]
MAISEADSKLLWGRAAGICSNPSCRADLTALLLESNSYNIGEMAHIIARSEDGPRGETGGGSDKYSNLILLCPTCHRHVDKSPEGTFTVEQLHQWKNDHENTIRHRMSEVVYENVEELKREVSNLLTENHMIWKEYGPQSEVAKEDPGSNLYKIWNLRKLDTVIPNNQKIINVIEANMKLLDTDDYKAFLLFKNHATSFEANQYCRLSSYTLFPETFSEKFQ